MHDQFELAQLNPPNRDDISRGIWFFVDPCAPQNRWDSVLRRIFGPTKIWKTSIGRFRHWNCKRRWIFCWTHRWASAYGWSDDWKMAPCPNANSWSVRAELDALDWHALRIVLAFPSNHNCVRTLNGMILLLLFCVKQMWPSDTYFHTLNSFPMQVYGRNLHSLACSCASAEVRKPHWHPFLACGHTFAFTTESPSSCELTVLLITIMSAWSSCWRENWNEKIDCTVAPTSQQIRIKYTLQVRPLFKPHMMHMTCLFGHWNNCRASGTISHKRHLWWKSLVIIMKLMFKCWFLAA